MTIETELPAVKVKALNKQAAALIVMINERIGSMFDDEATFSANEATQIMSMLEVVALKDDPGNGDGEAERLRHIVSDCAAALVSGAFISPKASVEFMEGLPKEVSLVVSGLRARCEKAEAALERSIVAINDWMHLYAPDMCKESDVAEAMARVHENGTLAYIANVQEQNRDALAAIRALIPEQKEG
jgi:hypothetical protein